MSKTGGKAPGFAPGELPEELFESAVRSLYRDGITLAVGTVSVVVAAVVLYVRNWEIFQLAFAIMFGFIGMVRLYDTVQFHRASRLGMDRERSRYWEMRYAVLAALHVGTLGLWCFLGFALSSDEFVHQMSVILMLSNLIGITGRNFASEKVVLSQTLTACATIIVGTVLFGDIYDLVLAMLLLPLFYAIWSMAKNLRNILFSQVIEAKNNKMLADRFDVALSNISHGLAMIDGKGRILVSNDRFKSLCGFPQNGSRTESMLEDKSRRVDRLDGDGDGDDSGLIAEVAALVGTSRHSVGRHVNGSGQTIEATYTPMAGEGGVVLLEDVTERVAAEEEIRKLASFDPLTALPNRRYFNMEVNRNMGGPNGLAPCTIYFLDLDNFKDVNDSLGHAIGDKLLCSIALRMRARMPEQAMIARFGGDEFVIAVPGRHTQEECQALADTLIEDVSKPVSVDGYNLLVGASIGIAQSPRNGSDYSQLLKVADMALYEAKAKGRGRASFYSDEIGDQIRERRALEADLRQALERGQLHVYFQPLINIHENRITTCEALLRWQHPERGFVPPSVFIPIAEDIGMIAKIGKFVIEEAVSNCKKWPQGVSVAVNVSSLQFQQSDVISVISEALAKFRFEPQRLEIEVTESAMLSDVNKAKSTLESLGKSGVRISLDDFGTGFSSLSYLHVLPLHKVKIDRSFIEDVQSDQRSLTLLSGVCQLAGELGLSVVVEGVETEQQKQLLCSKVRIDQMQGYLFGRAMPGPDIARILDAERAEALMPPRLASAG